MNIIFLEYPKCSTCQKAKKWLVKRPLVVGEDFVLVGFKEEEWNKYL